MNKLIIYLTIILVSITCIGDLAAARSRNRDDDDSQVKIYNDNGTVKIYNCNTRDACPISVYRTPLYDDDNRQISIDRAGNTYTIIDRELVRIVLTQMLYEQLAYEIEMYQQRLMELYQQQLYYNR